MSERLDLIASEGDGPNPPKLLNELVEQLAEMIVSAPAAGSNWLRGKSDAEVAKAAEIRAKAIQIIAGMELDRERLVMQRETESRKAAQEGLESERSHQAKMYELQTSRLMMAFESIVKLKDMGAEIDVQIINTLAMEMIESVGAGKRAPKKRVRSKKSAQNKFLPPP